MIELQRDNSQPDGLDAILRKIEEFALCNRQAKKIGVDSLPRELIITVEEVLFEQSIEYGEPELIAELQRRIDLFGKIALLARTIEEGDDRFDDIAHLQTASRR